MGWPIAMPMKNLPLTQESATTPWLTELGLALLFAMLLAPLSGKKVKSKTCHSLPPSPRMLFGCLLLLALPVPVAGHPLTMLGGCMQGLVGALGVGWIFCMMGGEADGGGPSRSRSARNMVQECQALK